MTTNDNIEISNLYINSDFLTVKKIKYYKKTKTLRIFYKNKTLKDFNNISPSNYIYQKFSKHEKFKVIKQNWLK